MIHYCILTHGREEVFRLFKPLAGRSIFIVDDFSEPEYYERIKPFADQFYQRKMGLNFSAQRNSVHEIIPVGDWICWLDSDEEIFSTFPLMAEKAVSETKATILKIGRNNYLSDDGKIVYYAQEYQDRLYQNSPGTFYVNSIHEHLVGSDFKEPHPEVFVNHHKTLQRQNEQTDFYRQFGP